MAFIHAMPLTVDQMVEETRSLPQDVVAELVDRILLATHGGQDPGSEQAWSRTVHARIEQIRSGAVTGISAAETTEKIRRIVSR
jgi:hypothetical protein